MTNEQLDALVERLNEARAHCGSCGEQAVVKNSRDQFICEACLHEVRKSHYPTLCYEAADAITALRARAEAAEADAERLAEDISFHRSQAARAMLRRYMNAPEDPHVEALCDRYGYGAVMDAASRLWARKDSVGAFYVGGCIGMKSDDGARAALARLREERSVK